VKYKLHMAYANREDLAREAVASVQAIGNIHAWPNGESCPIGDLPGATEVHYLPPMAPVSIINLLIQSSWNDDVMFWMHNDALALPGVAKRVLTAVEELHASDKKLGRALHVLRRALRLQHEGRARDRLLGRDVFPVHRRP
jgi:hypothetical protein